MCLTFVHSLSAPVLGAFLIAATLCLVGKVETVSTLPTVYWFPWSPACSTGRAVPGNETGEPTAGLDLDDKRLASGLHGRLGSGRWGPQKQETLGNTCFHILLMRAYMETLWE